MNCKETQGLLVAYQMQEITNETKKEIENHIESCKVCEQELKKTRSFFNVFDSVEEEIPNSRLKNNFEDLLQQEIKKEATKVISLHQKNNDSKVYLRIVASIALLIGAFFLGKNSNNNQRNTNNQQKVSLALLDNASASKRILAVSELEKSSIDDRSIINALINTFFIDENINVRMAACEALAKFSSLEEVKNALLRALEIEKEPAIQIELIQILTSIQEKRALVPMKKLLENEETPNYVKQELSYNIASLI